MRNFTSVVALSQGHMIADMAKRLWSEQIIDHVFQ